MKTKLNSPKNGYKEPIRLENPILDIGNAIKITINIALLNSMLKVLFIVLLME